MKKLSIFICLAFFISCKNDKNELYPPPAYRDTLIGRFKCFERAYMDKALDLNGDGVKNFDIFQEEYSGLPKYASICIITQSYDYPELNCLELVHLYSHYNILVSTTLYYFLKIDNDTHQMSIVERLNENHDENSVMYAYLENIEERDGSAFITIRQNFIDHTNGTESLEMVRVNFIFTRIRNLEDCIWYQ